MIHALRGRNRPETAGSHLGRPCIEAKPREVFRGGRRSLHKLSKRLAQSKKAQDGQDNHYRSDKPDYVHENLLATRVLNQFQGTCVLPGQISCRFADTKSDDMGGTWPARTERAASGAPARLQLLLRPGENVSDTQGGRQRCFLNLLQRIIGNCSPRSVLAFGCLCIHVGGGPETISRNGVTQNRHGLIFQLHRLFRQFKRTLSRI